MIPVYLIFTQFPFSTYLSQERHQSFMSIIGYVEFLDFNQIKMYQTILNVVHHPVKTFTPAWEILPYRQQLQQISVCE